MRWAARCAAAVCLCSTSAQAVSVGGYTFDAPPAEFASEPTRPYAISRAPRQIINIMCGVVPGRVVLACTLDDGKKPVIFVDAGLDPEVEAAALVHEKAHVNGWEHD